jgi:hypothetical protein
MPASGPVTDSKDPNDSRRCVARLCSLDAVLGLVAGKTEKPGGVDPACWFEGDEPSALYAVGHLPVSAFAPNQESERYDGTVDLARATRYAAMASAAPPVVAALSRDGSRLLVIDGGHRLSAARMRGNDRIAVIVRFKRGQLGELSREGGQETIRAHGWSINMSRKRLRSSGLDRSEGLSP